MERPARQCHLPAGPGPSFQGAQTNDHCIRPRPPGKARSPRPAPAPVVIPEGWETGGATEAPAAPARPAPTVRHGKCSFTLGINGTAYRLAHAIAGPPIEAVVTLRKTDGTGTYALATDGLDIHCTCPDHERHYSSCKHIMSIVAIARILAPFAAAAEGGAQ